MPPRSSWILLWLLLTGLTGLVRFVLRDLLLNLRSSQQKQLLRVAIYGSGEAGVQLASALRLAGKYRIVTFLDSNPSLWHRSINGVPIEPPHVLNSMKGCIDQVLLAIPSLARSERRRIVEELQLLDINVLQVPSVDDLTSGRARISELRPIAIEDLLGRDEYRLILSNLDLAFAIPLFVLRVRGVRLALSFAVSYCTKYRLS